MNKRLTKGPNRANPEGVTLYVAATIPLEEVLDPRAANNGLRRTPVEGLLKTGAQGPRIITRGRRRAGVLVARILAQLVQLVLARQMPVALAVVGVVPGCGDRTTGRVASASLSNSGLRVGVARAHRSALCRGAD